MCKEIVESGCQCACPNEVGYVVVRTLTLQYVVRLMLLFDIFIDCAYFCLFVEMMLDLVLHPYILLPRVAMCM